MLDGHSQGRGELLETVDTAVEFLKKADACKSAEVHVMRHKIRHTKLRTFVAYCPGKTNNEFDRSPTPQPLTTLLSAWSSAKNQHAAAMVIQTMV